MVQASLAQADPKSKVMGHMGRRGTNLVLDPKLFQVIEIERGGPKDFNQFSN